MIFSSLKRPEGSLEEATLNLLTARGWKILKPRAGISRDQRSRHCPFALPRAGNGRLCGGRDSGRGHHKRQTGCMKADAEDVVRIADLVYSRNSMRPFAAGCWPWPADAPYTSASPSRQACCYGSSRPDQQIFCGQGRRCRYVFIHTAHQKPRYCEGLADAALWR